MPEVIVVGSFVQDLAFRSERFPEPGETRIGRFQTGPGGKGFNQAVACSRLGVSTRFVGAIGDDLFGRGAETFAAGEGIDAVFERSPSLPSGAASIVIDDKARNAIVVALGANDALTPEFAARGVGGAPDARIAVAQLECNIEATASALASARERGLVTILNPAPINPNATAALLRSADVLVPNETEFSFLLEHCYDKRITAPEAFGDAELHELCALFSVPTVVITLGEAGSFVSHHDRGTLPPWAQSDSAPYYRSRALKVNAVDSTGAGDAFTGGLAAGMVHFPGEFFRAVRFATVTAGLSVEKPGTAPAMPTRNEVDVVFQALED